MARDSLRITDAERDDAVVSLGEHYAVGRLTKAEYDERVDRAWNARTGADLAPAFADLPTTHAEEVVRPRGRTRSRGAYPSRRPVPFVVVVVALIAVSALTHLPFFVFGLIAWFMFARHGWGAGWGHGGGHGWGHSWGHSWGHGWGHSWGDGRRR